MEYKIQITPTALGCLRSIRDANPIIFARIKKAIDRLAQDPQKIGSKLTDPLSRYWRIRVGDYRVIYMIQNDIVTVTILYAGHRKEVYKKISRFLKR